ncbi:Kinase, NEK [Giardia muris]|uniref:Kinase, NEK n=1 Tax=Giardia muris TaxID=5742 RepID=A0A4Z1SZ74_GIAMU|nr:Kinase, NEK [Giardia muris]|eukprot:TNJ28788.1 Kinase, NEK [Giardia muris]
MELSKLMRAAKRGNTRGVIRYLTLARQSNSTGLTALMLAAREGHTECVRLLSNEEGRMQDQKGMTALMYAARNGRLGAVELLMGSEAGLVTKNGMTALILAANNGHVEIVRLLKAIEAGMRDERQQTAIMYAARSGHAGVIRELVQQEGGSSNRKGWTALMLAARNGHGMCVPLLLCEVGYQARQNRGSYRAGVTALMIAARAHCGTIIKALLPFECGLKDDDGHTARWYAVQTQERKALESKKGETSIVELIDEEEGDVVLSRRSPPFRSAYQLQAEVVQLRKEVERLKEECSTAVRQLEGYQRSRLANGFAESLSSSTTIMIDNHSTKRGESRLFEAAIEGNLITVRHLFRYYKAQDSKGRTALMFAAEAGATNCVRALRPAEAGLQDQEGMTALMFAILGRHWDCVQLLWLERDLKSKKGETASELIRRVLQEMREDDRDALKSIHNLLEKSVEAPGLIEELDREYTITGSIGRGSYGHVYSVRSPTHQNYALKVVEYGNFNETKEAFIQNEKRAALELSHPNIMSCLRVLDDEDCGILYLLMPWYSTTLQEELKYRQGLGQRMRDDEIWYILSHLAAGLTYLHEKAVIHWDLKPENVFLASDGRYLISDFGFALFVDKPTHRNGIVGTRAYMAPELFDSEPMYSSSIDIWALGVVIYELCTWKKPFESAPEILKNQVPQIHDRPDSLIGLITSMLNKDPALRPTAREVFNVTVLYSQ